MPESASTPPARIFISYRREEAAYPAGWLYERLRHRYAGQVFKDVDSIRPGDDFVQAITEAVASCDVLLALIGDEWLTITDASGRRRLDDRGDFVRVEIEAALSRDVRVIPILIGRASMPQEHELPPGLAKLVRRQALELSPNRFDTRRLFDVLDSTLAEVRARNATTQVMAAASDPHQPMHADKGPLIDRQPELRLLGACLTSASSGRAAVVLIRGESGMGKSRLAETLIEQARRSEMLVALGHCTPVSGGELPFGPFVEMLSQIAGAPDSLERVTDATWELLRTVLTVSGPKYSVAPPDVGLERSRLFTSVLRVFHDLGERQPVVAVVEDIHWADSSSLDLLNYLVRTAGKERLLLVLTFRDDAAVRDPNTRRGIGELRRTDVSRDIHLKPLTANQVRQLLATSAVRLPRKQHNKVIDLCDGNPFIALELAAHDQIEGGPTEALRQALLGPVDELPDDARFALQVAAVMGQYIPHEVLENSIESTGGNVGAILRLLTGRGLLIAGPERYVFRHAIVRESVVGEMLHSELRAAHLAAVQGIRLSGRDGVPSGLAQLAHHLVAAGEYVAALPVVMSAAGYARGVYAFAEARRQLSVAREVLWNRVDDPEGISGLSYHDLLCREAEMARWAGQPSGAAKLLRTGISTAPPVGLERARLEHELGEALWAAGDPAASLASYERSAAALGTEPGEPALRARVLAAVARGLTLTGQYERGWVAAERAIALAAESGATREELQARITLAIVIARQGDLERGVAQLRQCLSEALAADAFEAVVRCFGNLAFIHSTAGRLGDVREIAAEGARTCQRFGPLLLVAPTLVENWVHALVATGRWDEAGELAHELQQQWAAEGMALALHLQLARIAAARGDSASFERQMSIIERFARPDDPYALHDLTAARVENLLWQGDADEAYRIARESLGHLADQQDAGLVVSTCALALRAHADLVTSRADRVIRESATRETAQLLSTAQDAARSDTGALGHAYLLLCEAEAARASMTQSAGPWTEVAVEWQLLECPYPAAYAQWRQAEELFGARARAQGTRALAAALHTATTLGCVPLENALRTLARHAGVSPDALGRKST
jgi:tetratricopeptide (TPR) repeat protein